MMGILVQLELFTQNFSCPHVQKAEFLKSHIPKCDFSQVVHTKFHLLYITLENVRLAGS